MTAKKIELDWDQYFNKGTDLPLEIIGDEETGLQRFATSRTAFEKWIKLMIGSPGIRVSRERLEKQILEGQKVVLLSDEELYRLNPEFYQRLLKKTRAV